MTEKLNDHLPTTPDMQAERLAELKRLFPDLFDGEGQLKLDEVKQLTGDEPQCRERYDFSWYGKRKAKETAYTPTTATLSYDEMRSVNPEKADGNLIIEGENLETLKTLLSAYREKIKCIYIDPPYNTGKDFVYSDNYTEDKRAYWEETGGLEKGVKVDTNPETAGRYHSNWLSMMYSRLLLARQLLKDDGVIFVSIDDNEVHNLRRLMDDVFGEENFIGLIIHNKQNAKNDTVNIQKNHEYVVCYRKLTTYITDTKIEASLENKKLITKEVFKEGSRFFIINDSITTRGDGGTLNNRKNLGYTVYYNPLKKDFLGVKDYDINLAQTSNKENEVYCDNEELLSKGYIKIRPPKVRGKLGAWTWELSKFNDDKDKIIIKKSKSNGYSVKKRTFISMSESDIFEKNDRYFISYENTSNSRSIIDFSTNEGSLQLAEALDISNIFSNPKNTNLIK